MDAASSGWQSWAGQNRMTPCRGYCGLKQSQADCTRRRCIGHLASANVYADSPYRDGESIVMINLGCVILGAA